MINGKKFKIPSSTQKLCLEAMKDGFHKIDYQGKVGKARKPKELMYKFIFCICTRVGTF